MLTSTATVSFLVFQTPQSMETMAFPCKHHGPSAQPCHLSPPRQASCLRIHLAQARAMHPYAAKFRKYLYDQIYEEIK
jgi:hypothetical protein